MKTTGALNISKSLWIEASAKCINVQVHTCKQLLQNKLLLQAKGLENLVKLIWLVCTVVTILQKFSSSLNQIFGCPLTRILPCSSIIILH